MSGRAGIRTLSLEHIDALNHCVFPCPPSDIGGMGGEKGRVGQKTRSRAKALT